MKTGQDAQISQSKLPSVYVIMCEKYIKIGVADNAIKRMAFLQTGNPFQLSLLKSWKHPCSDYAELVLHSLFQPYNIRGEWFFLPDRYVGILNEMTELPSYATMIKCDSRTSTTLERTRNIDIFFGRKDTA